MTPKLRPMPRRPALLLLALALAACGNAPASRQGFRSDAPIYSNAVLNLSQTQGRWAQVASFAKDPANECRSGGASILETATGLAILARLCLDGEAVDINSPLAITGPGRLTPTAKVAAPLDRAWWVLWADTDLRTLVIGTPDGSFGFILNRGASLTPAPLTPDRLAAAKQVLVFNGYDTTRLQVW